MLWMVLLRGRSRSEENDVKVVWPLRFETLLIVQRISFKQGVKRKSRKYESHRWNSKHLSWRLRLLPVTKTTLCQFSNANIGS